LKHGFRTVIFSKKDRAFSQVAVAYSGQVGEKIAHCWQRLTVKSFWWQLVARKRARDTLFREKTWGEDPLFERRAAEYNKKNYSRL